MGVRGWEGVKAGVQELLSNGNLFFPRSSARESMHVPPSWLYRWGHITHSFDRGLCALGEHCHSAAPGSEAAAAFTSVQCPLAVSFSLKTARLKNSRPMPPLVIQP